MKKLLLSVILSASCSLGFAKQVSLENAKVVAENFIGTKTSDQNPSINLIKSYGYPTPLVYVFSYNQDNGFVVVSGDDVAVPILGYSLEDSYPSSKISPEVTYWMNSYVQQIQYAQIHNKNGSDEVRNQWTALESYSGHTANRATNVAPLLLTKWDQLPYYNQLCPLLPAGSQGQGDRAPAGCVATAMAQIMKYWDNPTTGTGSRTYSSSTLGGTLSANFGTTTYDWANMPNTLNQNSTSVQKNAISTLMYQCGVAVNMDYDVDGSGSYVISYGDPNQACSENALKNYFGYKNTIKGYPRTDFQDSTWIKMLKFEIDNERPILYTGYGQVGGHAFVFDGYNNNDMFHINWGWSGMSNGYFVVDNLSPSALGTGAGAGNFNYGQEALTMIEPVSSILPPNPFTPDYVGANYHLILNGEPTSSSDTVIYGSTYSVAAVIKNTGTQTFSSNNVIALIAFDTTQTNSTVLRQRTVDILPDSIFNFAFATPQLTQLQPGVYYLILIYQDQGNGDIIDNPNGGNSIVLTVLPKPTDIGQVFNEKDISIFPNPAKSFINISSNNLNNKIHSIYITDVQGRKVLEENNLTSNAIMVNTETFANGTYFIKIETEKGTIAKKITIRK